MAIMKHTVGYVTCIPCMKNRLKKELHTGFVQLKKKSRPLRLIVGHQNGNLISFPTKLPLLVNKILEMFGTPVGKELLLTELCVPLLRLTRATII